jgi:hypothetical protein
VGEFRTSGRAPQRTDRRIKRDIDRIPPTLDAKVRAKCARTGISLRHLTLSYWAKWVLEPDQPLEPIEGTE